MEQNNKNIKIRREYPMSNFLNKKISLVDGHRIALVLVILLALFCIFLKIQNNQTIETLESNYSRSLYELVEYMDDVETLLAKAQISGTSEYAAKNFTEIWRKADLAQSTLTQIPITHITLEKVMQFLNQLSDYSYTLSHKAIENEDLTEEELKNISDFYDRCKKMNETLNSIYLDMQNGSLSWKELSKEQNTVSYAQQVSNISQDSFSQIEENMQDYEGLIYDGPFSEHMTSITPLGLGNDEVDEKTAQAKIYEYVPSADIKEIKSDGLIEGTIPVYNFDILLKDGSTVYIDVTKQGGKVLWFMNDRSINVSTLTNNENNNKSESESKSENNSEYKNEQNNENNSSNLGMLTVEEAKQKAKEFLNNHGFENMQDTYYTNENSMATINFAYVQDDVVCYTDLVKVKVALDTGNIMGMEAQSYYSSHRIRTIESPQITIDEAREKINKNIEITSEGKAIIPTDWRTEIPAYEFKGKVDDNEFIVYINTQTGKEEKIFMIIDTPNGILTL